MTIFFLFIVSFIVSCSTQKWNRVVRVKQRSASSTAQVLLTRRHSRTNITSSIGREPLQGTTVSKLVSNVCFLGHYCDIHSQQAPQQEEYSEFCLQHNQNGHWLNRDKFVLEKGFVPLVMRANRRFEHMRVALDRLSRVARINRTVLIVSHDSLDPSVVELTRSINFMVVRQIFNPFSANMLTDLFPGSTDQAYAHYVDQFGHSRDDGHLPGIKTHFLWHLRFVWEELLPKSVDHIVLMEDDQLPTFDFYVATRSLLSHSRALCPQCGSVVLGHHPSSKGKISQTVSGNSPFGVRLSGRNANLALSMSRGGWNALLDNIALWCAFDDYNWDLSLERLRASGLLPPHNVEVLWSRLFHFGFCGSTHGGYDDKKQNGKTCEESMCRCLLGSISY